MGAAVERGQAYAGVGELGPQVVLTAGEFVDNARERFGSAVAEFGYLLERQIQVPSPGDLVHGESEI